MEELYIIEKNGRRRKAEKHICENCKVVFLRRINEKRKREYCSIKCSGEIKTLKNTVEVKCHNCKNNCKKSLSKLKNSKHGFVFCSRACKDESQSLKGNCPEIRPRHYGTSEGRGVYKCLIKMSSTPQCEDCGNDRKYLLSVHHIDGDNKNNPEDGSNWEIVCANCHHKRHLKMKDGEWIFCTLSLTPRENLKDL